MGLNQNIFIDRLVVESLTIDKPCKLGVLEEIFIGTFSSLVKL